MAEFIIIFSFACILGILLRHWGETKESEKPLVSNQEIRELGELKELKKAEEFFKKGDYKRGEKFYLKAASLKPNDPKIYGRLGIIYLQNKNFKDAKEALLEAVRLDPENGVYQNNLGLAFYHLGQYKKAILHFENAVDLDDKIVRRWLNLALCYLKLKMFKEGEEVLKRAQELDPENEEIKRLLERVEKEKKMD